MPRAKFPIREKSYARASASGGYVPRRQIDGRTRPLPSELRSRSAAPASSARACARSSAPSPEPQPAAHPGAALSADLEPHSRSAAPASSARACARSSAPYPESQHASRLGAAPSADLPTPSTSHSARSTPRWVPVMRTGGRPPRPHASNLKRDPEATGLNQTGDAKRVRK
ncbi:hypothetical protein OC834_002341 [Tilletia horrida]|nr:hypothetical protein OC834_002341 [Tilletia horrida]